MKRSMMATILAGSLSLLVLGGGCGGSSGSGQTSGGATASAEVEIDIKLSGNPKYDKFFNDVIALYKRVQKAKRALDAAPKSLAKVSTLAENTEFGPALKAVAGRLKGKVTLNVTITEQGATVEVVPVAGVTLTAEEQAMVDAYKQAVVDVAAVPQELAPVVTKVVDLIKQAVVLAANAKNDFTGLNALRTLPSVIGGIAKSKKAMEGIKNDTPVVIDKSQSYILAIKETIAAHK
jgi:hypothetical protein